MGFEADGNPLDVGCSATPLPFPQPSRLLPLDEQFAEALNGGRVFVLLPDEHEGDGDGRSQQDKVQWDGGSGDAPVERCAGRAVRARPGLGRPLEPVYLAGAAAPPGAAAWLQDWTPARLRLASSTCR